MHICSIVPDNNHRLCPNCRDYVEFALGICCQALIEEASLVTFGDVVAEGDRLCRRGERNGDPDPGGNARERADHRLANPLHGRLRRSSDELGATELATAAALITVDLFKTSLRSTCELGR